MRGMVTLLGAAVHVANKATLHGSGSSLAEILGIAGAALALVVLWVGTRLLPRGNGQPALTVAQRSQREVAHASRLTAARRGRRARAPRTPLAR
jgi:hypothetical protein